MLACALLLRVGDADLIAILEVLPQPEIGGWRLSEASSHHFAGRYDEDEMENTLHRVIALLVGPGSCSLEVGTLHELRFIPMPAYLKYLLTYLLHGVRCAISSFEHIG